MSRQNKRQRPALQAAILIFLIGLLTEGFTYTWVRSRCHLTTRAIASETLLNLRLVKSQKRLKVEMAHLKSPRQLADRARKELNLSRPSPDQILRVKSKQ
ncbi:hypothetical protein [Desulfoluna sp.]|uniref:hypothetical protein n=1 Tax=Desulfoluna sp. TaxID=2045199 RepID=UPI0026050FC8|nr:hypothetical protein [Desulfoluna sp.]